MPIHFLRADVANKSENIHNAASIILLAGFELAKRPARKPVPDPITTLQAIYTYRPGSIQLKWRRTKYASIFKVMMTTTPADDQSWTQGALCYSPSYMVENLNPGNYFFQIIAIGSGGESIEGSVASCIAA